MGSNQIFVTNTNDFDHADFYDGEEYVFPQGERVMIPYDAAVHMFAYNLKDQSDALVRLGWAMRYDSDKKQYVEDEHGVEKLAKFIFDEVAMVPKSSLERKLAKTAAAT